MNDPQAKKINERKFRKKEEICKSRIFGGSDATNWLFVRSFLRYAIKLVSIFAQCSDQHCIYLDLNVEPEIHFFYQCFFRNAESCHHEGDGGWEYIKPIPRLNICNGPLFTQVPNRPAKGWKKRFFLQPLFQTFVGLLSSCVNSRSLQMFGLGISLPFLSLNHHIG